MLRRYRHSRRIVTSWILGTALALMSAAVALADGGGSNIPH
jgi:hypothetical protein